MNNSNRLLDLENQLKAKKEELFKMKNSKLKLFFILVICTFLLPFLPAKGGGGLLIDKYGYWGSVLFISITTFGITSLIYFGVIENYQQSINELERKVEQEKLVQELFKDKNE